MHFRAFLTTYGGIDFQIVTWSIKVAQNRIFKASLSLSASLWMMSVLLWLCDCVLVCVADWVYIKLNLMWLHYISVKLRVCSILSLLLSTQPFHSVPLWVFFLFFDVWLAGITCMTSQNYKCHRRRSQKKKVWQESATVCEKIHRPYLDVFLYINVCHI